MSTSNNTGFGASGLTSRGPSVNAVSAGSSISNIDFQKLEKPTRLTEAEAIIGYKGFKTRPDGTLYCRDQEYKIGEKYILCQEPKACSVGLHFCRTLTDVFTYYNHKTEGHVYYKVKGWGRISEEKDKVAVDHLELIEKVTDRELFVNFLQPHMDKIDKIVADNPNVAISGSLALILLGWLPYRDIGDIDVTIPYYGGFKDAIIANQFNSDQVKSGTDTIQMVLDNISFDCFINPFHTYTVFNFEGKEYKITDPKAIVQAKFKYLLEGNTKHAVDLGQVFKKIVEYNGRDSKKAEIFGLEVSAMKDPNNKNTGFFPKNKNIDDFVI